MEQTLLIRFGEISLKGKNRREFERKLLKNLKNVLGGIASNRVETAYGRMYVPIKDDVDTVIQRVRKVFGIVSVSVAAVTLQDLAQIKQAALEQLEGYADGGTFKVETKRPDKRFPMQSPEISKEVGAHLLDNTTGWSVDVHQPDVTVMVEVRREGVYVYTGKIPCNGGLPVGSTGRGVLLLSGGIDSPVAGWLGMKRGLEIVGLHFHSFPFTSERSKEKVIDLARIISAYGGRVKLHINHFTDIQKAIRQNCPEEFYVTIMRRMMFRIADRIAKEEGALALVTGENLGQVASQTLESMGVINEVTKIPVLRPLVTFDKQEIMDYARQIDTYETSILPYEDCCTLFMPKHPATRPKLGPVQKAESVLDIEALIQGSLEKSEVVIVKPD
ncbi:tRNA 4-thiouridine(8) synthase ThiI [Metallumcola ferriviriculae]|uniref:Probable tRNA sulfurtransferase n=1 Tax=Metallumcola ferriviriculae TaxID=3039180 RepID=A0AAU0UGB5_9FIRM|nr:tRNA 4-thiouridine(8) synthase ThiI [Desulfitibacteraceae bacterium MK1]